MLMMMIMMMIMIMMKNQRLFFCKPALTKADELNEPLCFFINVVMIILFLLCFGFLLLFVSLHTSYMTIDGCQYHLVFVEWY